MTNKEYIEQHPEQFRDDIDKWLFTEFSIIGGCSSAHGSVEYTVARMVAERLFKAQGNRTYYECVDEMKKQWLDKACEWLATEFEEITRLHLDDKLIKRFNKAMEE